jgi:hypothetical protein
LFPKVGVALCGDNSEYYRILFQLSLEALIMYRIVPLRHGTGNPRDANLPVARFPRTECLGDAINAALEALANPGNVKA